MDWISGQQNQPFQNSIKSSLYSDRHRPVYVLSELIDPGPAVTQLAADHRAKPQELMDAFKVYNPVIAASMPDGFALYRLSY
jgi:hypothetical protein